MSETGKSAGIITFESLMSNNEVSPFAKPTSDISEDAERQIEDHFVSIGEPGESGVNDKDEPGGDSSLKDKENNGGSGQPNGSGSDNSSTDSGKQNDDPDNKKNEPSHHHQMLKKLFGKSEITVLIERDGQEVEVPVEEVNLDEDQFAQIVQEKIRRDKEEATKDKISTEGVSDFVRDIIEIDKRGGKIADLIKLRESYLDPLNQIDTTTIEGQKAVLRLRLLAANNDEESIDIFISGYEQKGILEQKALAAEAEIREAVKAQVENRKQAAIKAIEDEKERVRTFRKEMKAVVDKEFELNDAAKSRLIDFATKTDDKNHIAELDRKFFEAKQDPKRALLLSLLLSDEEEFFKQVTRKEVTETKLSTAIKLGTVKSDKTASDTDLNHNKGKGDDEHFIALPNLK